MGKPKQQVISRFFAPKPPPSSSQPSSKPSPGKITITSKSPPSSSKPSSKPSPRKITATVSFSPNKRPKTSPSIHERFVSKLLEPSSPSPSEPSKSISNPKHTPLELQVIDLKAKYPEVILMVEVGYKYRFFGSDAEIAARVLGIFAHVDHNFLTASVPTFRLAVHVRRLVAAGYKVGVIKQTETPAIKAHGTNRVGPFSRGLSALYTKSTIEAAEEMGGAVEELSGGGSNYLICVVEKEVEIGAVVESGNRDVRIGVVAVEVSTGEVVHTEFSDNVMRSGLEAVILSLAPAEILIGEPLSFTTEKLLRGYAGPLSNVRIEQTSRECFKDGGALAEVMSLYEKTVGDTSTIHHCLEQTPTKEPKNDRGGIEGIISMPELTVQALALVIRYLKHFGFERLLCSGASFRPFSSNIEMTLSANTIHQLEILKNNSDGSTEGSLLQVMNLTSTAFGSRLLKHWVTHPLCDRNSICARLDAVAEVAESIGSCSYSQNADEQGDGILLNSLAEPQLTSILSSVLTMLAKSPDIQRGITRIFHRTATATEFISVIHALLLCGKQLQKLQVEDNDGAADAHNKRLRSSLLKRLILTASSPTVTGHAAKLLSLLNKDAADQGDMLGVFVASDDQFPEVAGSRLAVQIAEDKLNLLIGQYRKQLGRSLEFVSVSGTTHLIELPADVRVPLNWVKVSSTKKTIRYHPPEVLAALERLLLAREELAVVCKSTWDSFLRGFSKYYAQFQAAVQALAALDCLYSLAVLSRNPNYVRPVFVDDDKPFGIHICAGRHPVLESILGDSFVPNDTYLNADGEYCEIVTGPNMGGKSCYIRQVALIAIMAQVGSFVPAMSAKMHVLDQIHTRMGASDSIQQGTSTFLEELSETSHILKHCSSHSLVIIDELGRGTSTHDGVAIAYATLHHLIHEKKCMVLFVTHYPQIADIQKESGGSVGAYHVSYLTSMKPLEITGSEEEMGAPSLDQGEVTFLYKIVPGASDKSFGLNVARLAQLPASCISRAAVMASKLEMDVTTCGRIQVDRSSEIVPSDGGRKLAKIPECKDRKEEEEHYNELATVCCKILSIIKEVHTDGEPAKVAASLIHARELALEITKR